MKPLDRVFNTDGPLAFSRIPEHLDRDIPTGRTGKREQWKCDNCSHFNFPSFHYCEVCGHRNED